MWKEKWNVYFDRVWVSSYDFNCKKRNEVCTITEFADFLCVVLTVKRDKERWDVYCDRVWLSVYGFNCKQRNERRTMKEFGMQLHGQPWRSTTSTPTLSESSKTSMTRPLVQSSSTAAYETGSEQKLQSDRDVYSRPPSSTYFWKGS